MCVAQTILIFSGFLYVCCPIYSTRKPVPIWVRVRFHLLINSSGWTRTGTDPFTSLTDSTCYIQLAYIHSHHAELILLAISKSNSIYFFYNSSYVAKFITIWVLIFNFDDLSFSARMSIKLALHIFCLISTEC